MIRLLIDRVRELIVAVLLVLLLSSFSFFLYSSLPMEGGEGLEDTSSREWHGHIITDESRDAYQRYLNENILPVVQLHSEDSDAEDRS
jgi:hypothetical protein